MLCANGGIGRLSSMGNPSKSTPLSPSSTPCSADPGCRNVDGARSRPAVTAARPLLPAPDNRLLEFSERFRAPRLEVEQDSRRYAQVILRLIPSGSLREARDQVVELNWPKRKTVVQPVVHAAAESHRECVLRRAGA